MSVHKVVHHEHYQLLHNSQLCSKKGNLETTLQNQKSSKLQ